MGVTKNGIDVSAHNGNIQWNKVKTDFVMIRSGWSWYEGGMNIDKYFETNVEGCRANDIPFGVYIYAYDKSVSAALTAADMLCDLLDKVCKDSISYPVAYDFEDGQYFKTNKSLNTEICRAFLHKIADRGYHPILYTYTNFSKNYLNMADLSGFDFWVADYTGNVGWTGAYSMWQHSANGKIEGIPTSVDLNICYKDYPAIISMEKEANETGITKDQKKIIEQLISNAKERLETLEEYLDSIHIVGGQ